MIYLRNGHEFQFMASSGAFGFDGQGWWFWEKPLIKSGLIDPRLFTIVTKTITKYPREGNPYHKCIRPIPGGVVNKVGLKNPGLFKWLEECGPKIGEGNIDVILSLTAEDTDDLIEMIAVVTKRKLNIKGIEFNSRYMAGDDSPLATDLIVQTVQRIDEVFPEVPLILKLSYGQSYLEISSRVKDNVDAISINSVPASCLSEEERRECFKWYGGEDPTSQFGGGAISGGPARLYQRTMIKNITELDMNIPVIGPGVRKYDDINILTMLGAKAFSFGHIFLPFAPWWRPKRIVKRYLQNIN